MHRAPRFYYGWIIVAIASFTMMIIIGIFFTSGVLFAAIVAEFGWSRTAASLPFSIGLISYAATAWVAGRLFDAYGPRWVFPLGVLCMSGGLIVSAQATTAWQLCVGWGLLAAQGFNLAGYAPHMALVSQWFERRRGAAAGLVLGGASLGALFIVPLTQYMVGLYGWRATYTALGVAVALLLVPLNALWQRHRPQDVGLYPDGDVSGSSAVEMRTAAAWGLSHLLDTARSPRFWFLFLSVCSIGWLSNITTVHQLAHMVDSGFAQLLAASVIGLTGLLRAISSTLWGGLSDRFGREPVSSLALYCAWPGSHVWRSCNRLPRSGYCMATSWPSDLATACTVRFRRPRPRICFRPATWAPFWDSWNWAGGWAALAVPGSAATGLTGTAAITALSPSPFSSAPSAAWGCGWRRRAVTACGHFSG